MTERSTLRTLLESLGTDILQVTAAPRGLDVVIGHPVIDDPADAPFLDQGDLLLAVGTPASSSAAAGVVQRAGREGAAGVIFRGGPGGAGGQAADVLAAAEATSVAVLTAVPEMAWSQLHTLLRSAVAASASSSPEAQAAGAIGDLFGLANAIADMVGGPTTIEDPQSTVLAYSILDSPIDEARRETILGRRVPEQWLQRLHDDGVFRRLWGTDEVVRIDYPGEEPELRPRLAVAVRAGGEVLGSVWVAEGDRPLDDTAETALREAGRIAALHIMRARSGEDLHRSWRSNLLRAMLDGHDVAAALAEALDASEQAYVTVVGFRLAPGSATATDVAVQGRRACRLLDLYCESTRRRGAAVVLGPAMYLLVVDDAPPAPDRMQALATELAGREGQMLPAGTTAGVGSSYQGFNRIPGSRSEADRVLAVLADLPGQTVGTIQSVRGHAVLMRLQELAAAEPELLRGYVDELEEHDSGGRGQYVQTLRAYLDAFGDVAAAAAVLEVHPNTFRYRMRRLGELSGLSLDDPVERLVAHLQLHLRG